MTRWLVPLLLLIAPPANAHPLAPTHLVIAVADGRAELTLTYGRDTARPDFTAPPSCPVEQLATTTHAESRVSHLVWHCALAGQLRLTAEAGAPPLIVEIKRATGTTLEVLDAAHPLLDLAPAVPSLLMTLATWTRLGVEHLLGGLDHLFLVLGLALVIGLRWRLFAALTAFTIGHSLSLALGATGVLVLPSALVESAIALTLIALALDLVCAREAPHKSLFEKAPWLTGLTVGLIHGLGFAGVLSELGLPRDQSAVPLLGFNLGLELAQLGAVLVFGGIYFALRATPLPLRHVPTSAGWLLGMVSSAWLVERALAL